MEKEEDKWTKKELTLRSGLQELALAIIERWVKDGKPEKDLKIIKCWQQIANINKNKETF